MSRPEENDPDNPEWTEADFARAKPASELPPDIKAAFDKTKGAEQSPAKIVSRPDSSQK